MAIAGYLEILSALYGRVLIPGAVVEELQLDSSRPGARNLTKATEEGWLEVEEAPSSADKATLTELLDRGEAEAILLAQFRKARLLIDERKGRTIARSRGVTVIGTGGVLLLAKRGKVIGEIAPVLDALETHGYRLSSALRQKLMSLANEA